MKREDKDKGLGRKSDISFMIMVWEVGDLTRW